MLEALSSLLLGLSLTTGSPAVPPLRVVGPEVARSTYWASRPEVRGLALDSHRFFGHHQRVRRRSDGRTEVTVVVDPRPLPTGVAWPLEPSDGRLARWARPSARVPELDQLAAELTHGLRTDREVSERILTWVGLAVTHADRPGHDESPLDTLLHRRASCVGRSELAIDLLRRAGIPARPVHGLLVPRAAPSQTPLGSAHFELHRFVASHLEGAGWVLSDPGESVHLVDTRHLILSFGEQHDLEAQRHLRITLVGHLGAFTLPGSAPVLGSHGREPAITRPVTARRSW